MNQKQKELVKIFIFLFVFSFIVVNWSDVSWMFNYRQVSGLVYDFFNPYPDNSLLIQALVNANPVRPVPITASAVTTNKSTVPVYPYSPKENSMEIPAIGLKTPMILGESTNIDALEKQLDKGVVVYPGSVAPGDSGQMVVLGHSAPPNWPRVKHDWVFTDLNKLVSGDKIYMHFNRRQYTFTVTYKNIVAIGQDITATDLPDNMNILTLVSCWPPGKNYKRITVQAELLPPVN